MERAEVILRDAVGSNPCESLTCGEYEICRLSPTDDNGQHTASCVCRDQHCDPVMLPICASDGRSYDNQCEMRRHSCAVRQHVYVRSRALCGMSNRVFFIFCLLFLGPHCSRFLQVSAIQGYNNCVFRQMEIRNANARNEKAVCLTVL